MKKALFLFILCFSLVLPFFRSSANAAKTVTLTSVITQGVLLTDIRDQLGRTIINPILDFGRVINSFDCRYTDDALNASLGSDNERIYVDNPKAAYDGWTLTIAAAEGKTATWYGNDGATFDFNDSGGYGCFDEDSDGVAGLLEIDPSKAKLVSDCLECTTDHLFLGANGPRNFSDTDSITLLRATSDSDFLGSWFMTNVGVTQTIPPEQDGDTYELDMVLTATAT